MYKLRLATTQCGRAANVFATGKDDFNIEEIHPRPWKLSNNQKLNIENSVFTAVSRNATTVATEPKGPYVKTDIPGPKSKALLQELSKIQVRINEDNNIISLS